MTAAREQRQVFGEVAEAYDDIRPGYPAEILERILAYAGHVPAQVVESGAGTGKGTALLRALGVPLTCVEPDPAMAAVLTRTFTGDELVRVFAGRFEDWTPPAGGVDLLASAQAWHWVDHLRRTDLAARALRPGGVLAVFGHDYGFADEQMSAALNDVYLRIAPEIAEGSARIEHPGVFHPNELRRSAQFADVDEQQVVTVVPFPTPRYLALLTTFSPHRMLPEDRRARLHAALAEVIDARGGVVEQKLTTGLWLARRGMAWRARNG
ncbi:MAG: class I SAM-dependent methyltransferase [Hamadaea sp.]|nr:class I SAM-dependent methyltransferase [Hamadaea sp.]